MGDRTGIEWTDATWNPVRGCTRISAGCMNCYAERTAARFNRPGEPYEGLVKRVGTEARWTGKMMLVEHKLDEPLHWAKPRRIFVNSMSDLFHESVPDKWIDRIFAVMARAPRHTFQILTKRAERMRSYLSDPALPWRIASLCMPESDTAPRFLWAGMPLANVWLGVSVEDQPAADTRIPELRATPAAIRFLSVEPMIGPVQSHLEGIDLVICGGESGPGARHMELAWAESLLEQCRTAGVYFFMKQMSGSNKARMPEIPDYLMVREMLGAQP